jgi:putative glycosyltransferase
MTDLDRPALSIVTSLYKSAPFLRDFHARMSRAAARLTSDYEIVLVNDGSPDESLRIGRELCAADLHVRLIDLSRNFGHHKALMTGLMKSRGELVFLIDCDLEEDPEWLERFYVHLLETGADVVYGVQATRKGRWVERAAGALAFRVLNLLLSHPIPVNVLTARLMRRRYVEALVQHRDQEICLAGLWAITGFDQRPLVVTKSSRASTSYSLRRRISVFVNAVTSFSNRPLLYIFQLGFAVMLLSIVAGAVLLYKSLSGGVGVPGWASIMVSIWFLGGLTIFCIGVLGVYLAKVFSETKARPYTIVREEYGAERLVSPGVGEGRERV